ncbi:hypothetical protein [Luteolibacter sp. LG18]|uniref:hypothetical protein n=1 Tax=Luteolibacter sp. LG18 TaxID=2819286 RepID=UPI002B325397|nr:hypothetical protein llg_32870 [Luteolibacter sp. LG18]
MPATISIPKRFHGILATFMMAGIAQAHQPYESSAHARFDGETLELTVVASLEIAGRMVGDPSGSIAALEELRPQLVTEGAGLYEVTADGKRLEAERVFFSIREGEAVFSMIFPVGNAAKLGFRAAYLDKLPIGYGGSIEVIDESGKVLGLNPLLKKGADKDTFGLPLTALISTSVPSATPVTPASPSAVVLPVAVEPQVDVRWSLLVAILAVYFLAVWIARRVQKSRN